jgi:hypothetical protein
MRVNPKEKKDHYISIDIVIDVEKGVETSPYIVIIVEVLTQCLIMSSGSA